MAAKPHTQATRAEDVGNEFLVFTLGEEEYGIDILKVQEIRGYDAATVTRIANVPSFIKGVTNLARHHRAHRGPAHQVQPGQRRIQRADRRHHPQPGPPRGRHRGRRGVGRADAQRGPGASGARVRRHPVHRVP